MPVPFTADNTVKRADTILYTADATVFLITGEDVSELFEANVSMLDTFEAEVEMADSFSANVEMEDVFQADVKMID